MDATITKTAVGYEGRFEWPLPHPADKVWAAITEPERLAQWLANAEVELAPGGKYHLHFQNTGDRMNGQVTEVQAPTLLAYTWSSPDEPSSLVRWALTPHPEGCLLVMTHILPSLEVMPVMLAGWQTHLEILETALAGRPIPWPWHRWEELRDRYTAIAAGGDHRV